MIVNLVDRQVELFEDPVPDERRYGRSTILGADASLTLELDRGRLEAPVRDLLP